MNTPSTYTPEQLAEWATSVTYCMPDGRWVAARPLGRQGIYLRQRIKAAWMVFTGRADILVWTGQPERATNSTENQA